MENTCLSRDTSAKRASPARSSFRLARGRCTTRPIKNLLTAAVQHLLSATTITTSEFHDGHVDCSTRTRNIELVISFKFTCYSIACRNTPKHLTGNVNRTKVNTSLLRVAQFCYSSWNRLVANARINR